MKQCYLFLVLVLIFCHCKNSSTFIEHKNIGIDFLPENNIPDSIITRINYVPLETNNESLIGRIDKMLIRNGRIYILDANFSKSLFVFDTLGKYLFKIHKMGKGPGEYMELNDFEINNNKIILLAYRSVLFFDLNGEYLFTKKFKWIAENISIKSEKEIYLFHNTYLNPQKFAPFHIIKTDIGFNRSIEYFKPLKQEFHSSYRFQQYENSILLTSPPLFLNTIYEVSDKNYSPFITFDFIKFHIPEDLLKGSTLSNDLNNYPIILNSAISNNIVSFSFKYQGYLYLGLHFNKCQKTFTGKKITNIPVSVPNVCQIINNQLYTFCDSYIFIENYNNNLKEYSKLNLKYKNEFVSNLIKNKYISETSNPVIICFSINNNLY